MHSQLLLKTIQTCLIRFMHKLCGIHCLCRASPPLFALIGYPFAFTMSKIHPKYRPPSYCSFFVVLPFWTNSLIRIYGMKVFLGVKGILNTMLIDMGILSAPIVF